MEKLFNDSDLFQKERPTDLTESQKIKFYLEKAKEIIEQNFCEEDEDENEIAEDLKGLDFARDNGYELAKKLEWGKSTYKIDVNFCEWLDGLYYDYRSIHTQNVRDWVLAHNPTPKFEKGTKLVIEKELCPKMGKGLTVYINGSRPEEAVYWVNTDPDVYGGTVLSYELVESNCVKLDN